MEFYSIAGENREQDPRQTLWGACRAFFAHQKKHDILMLDHFIALIQNHCPHRAGGRSSLLFDDSMDAGLFWDFAKLNYRVPQRRQVVMGMQDALAWVHDGVTPLNLSWFVLKTAT